MSPDDLDPELPRAIATRLADRLALPVELASLGGEGGPGMLLIRHGGVAHLLAPRAPRRDEARAAELSQAAAVPAPIVVADALPVALRADLRRLGLAHADRAGTAWLRLPGLIVDLDPQADDDAGARRGGRQRRARPDAAGNDAARPLVNAFSDAGGLLLRALLRDPDRVWRQQDLVNESGLSNSFVSDIIRSLSASHHVIGSGNKRGKSIRIADPARLLLDWARKVDRPGPATHVFWVDAPLPDREALLARAFDTPDLAGRWALTLHAAGRHLAPHVVQDQLHAYVAADHIDAAAARLEDEFFLARVPADRPAQGNIHLLAPHDARGTFVDAAVIDGVPVVSTVQLFLDLVHWPLRGSEGVSALIRGPLGDQLHLDADARRALLAQFQ